MIVTANALAIVDARLEELDYETNELLFERSKRDEFW